MTQIVCRDFSVPELCLYGVFKTKLESASSFRAYKRSILGKLNFGWLSQIFFQFYLHNVH